SAVAGSNPAPTTRWFVRRTVSGADAVSAGRPAAPTWAADGSARRRPAARGYRSRPNAPGFALSVSALVPGRGRGAGDGGGRRGLKRRSTPEAWRPAPRPGGPLSKGGAL